MKRQTTVDMQMRATLPEPVDSMVDLDSADGRVSVQLSELRKGDRFWQFPGYPMLEALEDASIVAPAHGPQVWSVRARRLP